MRKYFIHNGVAENGPFSIEQLKEFPLKNDTPVWYEGLQNWTIVGNINELKSLVEIDALPPKFDKFTFDISNIKPPRFIDPTELNFQKPTPRKKKTTRNIVIVLGVLSLLFMGLMAFSYADSDSYYDENGNLIEINNAASIDETERNRINEELTIKNRNYRNNFEKYIRVSTNQYSYNVLGGISNLDVIVFNDTEYMLNEIIVNVDYIKDNGDIYKSESIIINNIPPYQNKSVSAPESSRGTSVDVRMDGINSKKMHFCFFVTNGIGTFSEPEFPEDPYFCR
jgi:hypothetical protein